jgi:alcohol dehydrogenase (cytochrome c)
MKIVRAIMYAMLPVLALAQIKVPYERIREAHKEPGNWLTYSGGYNGQRYSLLDQINTGECRKAQGRLGSPEKRVRSI